MPIYTYKCMKCSHTFDLLCGINQEKVHLACPACKSEKVKKQCAPFGVSGSSRGRTKCSSCSSGSCSSCS